jgi:acyl-CoA synthetase (NDP forming)
VVIGASERRPAPVANVMRGSARAWGVNPRGDSVLGLECATSVAALPETPELAMLMVGHDKVEAAFEEAAVAGVRAFVVPGLGNESGRAGREIAARLGRRAGELGAALLGPNCMGVAVPGRASPWLGQIAECFLPGHVAVVAESGSVAESFVNGGPRTGFRCVVSTGGEADRDVADFLAWFAGDSGTRAVGLFLETVRRPAALGEGLERCAAAGKPVVCLAVGHSEAARRAAASHTGALATSIAGLRALLRRHGVIEVDDIHDLFETLEVLGRARWPAGLRAAAVSESGGECALLADQAAEAGLRFEPLPDGLAVQLRREFPNFLEPNNPLDAWAVDHVAAVFPRTLELLASSGAYDVLLAQIDLTRFRGRADNDWCEIVIRALAAAAAGRPIVPAVTTVHTTDPPDRLAALARELDVALLRGPAHTARALAGVGRWSQRRTR